MNPRRLLGLGRRDHLGLPDQWCIGLEGANMKLVSLEGEVEYACVCGCSGEMQMS